MYSGKSQGLYKQEKTAINLMEHMGQWGCISVNYKLSMRQHQLVELCIRGLGQKTTEIFTRGQGVRLNCILKDELELLKGSWYWKVERHPR